MSKNSQNDNKAISTDLLTRYVQKGSVGSVKALLANGAKIQSSHFSVALQNEDQKMIDLFISAKFPVTADNLSASIKSGNRQMYKFIYEKGVTLSTETKIAMLQYGFEEEFIEVLTNPYELDTFIHHIFANKCIKVIEHAVNTWPNYFITDTIKYFINKIKDAPKTFDKIIKKMKNNITPDAAQQISATICSNLISEYANVCIRNNLVLTTADYNSFFLFPEGRNTAYLLFEIQQQFTERDIRGAIQFLHYTFLKYYIEHGFAMVEFDDTMRSDIIAWIIETIDKYREKRRCMIVEMGILVKELVPIIAGYVQ